MGCLPRSVYSAVSCGAGSGTYSMRSPGWQFSKAHSLFIER
nr:MAG TPA: hypothetical protein [Caudoviricetes sp.]